MLEERRNALLLRAEAERLQVKEGQPVLVTGTVDDGVERGRRRAGSKLGAT
jgi:hypothetical protein